MVHEKKGLSSKAKLLLSYMVVFLAAVSFFFLDPKFTGYVTTDAYSEPVRITAYGEKEYSFAGNAEGVEINSFMMSGKVYGEGKVSIFLEDENGQRFVVFTNREESAFNLITGLAGKEGKGVGSSQSENNGIKDNNPGKENKGNEISESKKPEKESDGKAEVAQDQKPRSIGIGKEEDAPASKADENAGRAFEKSEESEDKEKSINKKAEEQKQDYEIKKQGSAETGAARAQDVGDRNEISQDNNKGAAAEKLKIKCIPGDIEKVAGLCRECGSYGAWEAWEKCPDEMPNAKLVSNNFFVVKELGDAGQNPGGFESAGINNNQALRPGINTGWLQNQPIKEQPAMEFSNACKETCLLYIKPNFKLIVEVEEGTVLEIGNVTYSVNT